jgi:hypothetical protein
MVLGWRPRIADREPDEHPVLLPVVPRAAYFRHKPSVIAPIDLFGRYKRTEAMRLPAIHSRTVLSRSLNSVAASFTVNRRSVSVLIRFANTVGAFLSAEFRRCNSTEESRSTIRLWLSRIAHVEHEQ